MPHMLQHRKIYSWRGKVVVIRRQGWALGMTFGKGYHPCYVLKSMGSDAVPRKQNILVIFF